VSEISLNRRIAVFAMVALVLTGGCRRRERGGFASMLNMGDPSTASQLASGFHAIEQGSWRWTAKKFSVVLKPPTAAEQKGATLRFRMFISDDQINRLGALTLSADVNGQALEPQVFNKPGDNIYTRPVPPEALQTPTAKVNFALDKAREPDASDGRQLGVVAIVVGLQPR
jgi:hypothetical protein